MYLCLLFARARQSHRRWKTEPFFPSSMQLEEFALKVRPSILACLPKHPVIGQKYHQSRHVSMTVVQELQYAFQIKRGTYYFDNHKYIKTLYIDFETKCFEILSLITISGIPTNSALEILLEDQNSASSAACLFPKRFECSEIHTRVIPDS